MIDFMMSWGCITPIEQMPTPDLAVPYAAPRSVIANQKSQPKEGYTLVSDKRKL
jgi:hypothetical protein